MKRFWICRAVYFILLLLIALPVSAYYHNHSSGGMFIIGILLLLILIPLVKILFYAFLVLVTNKWTWIIGGGLLFLVVLVNIDNEQKKNWHPQTNYPSSSQVQYNSTSNPQPIGFRGNLLVKRPKFFYCTYSLGITETS